MGDRIAIVKVTNGYVVEVTDAEEFTSFIVQDVTGVKNMIKTILLDAVKEKEAIEKEKVAFLKKQDEAIEKGKLLNTRDQ